MSPCKDCEKRVLGCHSNCAEYVEFKNKRKDEADAKSKYYEVKRYNAERAIKIYKKHRNKS